VPNHLEEDLRPLAQRVARERVEGDVIIVYPWAKFAFFLYSGLPFSIPSRQEYPFEVPYTLASPGVIFLNTNIEDEWSREIDQSLGTPKRIWLVASHILYRGGADIEGIRSHLAHLGYHPDHKEERADAFIELWLPSDSLAPVASPAQ
jgi:hypothetical protein